MCPLGGYAILTSSPQSKVMCDKGIVLVEGATGTCSAEGHGFLYATSSHPKVKINGMSVICVGDRTSCGGYVEEGSDKVDVS